ncbi:unnamed protein product [Brassicogethes aeneus]|uniref:Mitochondrial dicarboxylate carrier n=1 Tax=Brassicogethes aeneus TaxID=1431903 RepID=A0A9P0BIU6_BRAAE|nr:unnamed protein product [Brassicogethes aeneus]
MGKKQSDKIPRWYFGGIASIFAGCCVHPLDLIKVHLQTHPDGKTTIPEVAKKVLREHGIFAFYSGISAAVMRQFTYSTTRFGIYEVLKQKIQSETFTSKVAIGTVSGVAGGIVGAPSDLVNVRMQNDLKLPKEQRRNYKNAFDGLWRVYKEEGVKQMFSGAGAASSRSVLMTVGQLSFYDQIKMLLLKTAYFDDNVITHFTSSFIGAILCVLISQPADTTKTLAMEARPGELISVKDKLLYAKKQGFYRGTLISSIRFIPLNILTFVFFEQLVKYYGKPRPGPFLNQ